MIENEKDYTWYKRGPIWTVLKQKADRQRVDKNTNRIVCKQYSIHKIHNIKGYFVATFVVHNNQP